MLHRALRRAYWTVLEASPPPVASRLSYLRAHGRLPNLNNPRRFTEWVFVTKLWGDHEAFARLADKVLVKDYVASVVGSSFVVPTLWHGSCLPPREERTWPLPFVLKANHGSGMNALVRSPGDLDWDVLEAKAEAWLRTGWPAWLCEDWYNRIDRQLLVEPLLGDSTAAPTDYKVTVFAGRAQFIQVNVDRYGDHRCTFFDRNWMAQPYRLSRPLIEGPYPPPRHLREILEAAEALGRGFDYVRVDFYDLPEGPKVGEMTFSDGSGLSGFKPSYHDLEWGQLWADGRTANSARR